MPEPKSWHKQVAVLSGPQWCQGKTGYLDETTGFVFFNPQGDPISRQCEFEFGYVAALLTLETIRKTTERTSTKAKSDVADAFQT